MTASTRPPPKTPPITPSPGSGPDGNQVIPVTATSAPAPLYDPGANIDVATGLTYPTAVQQTVTLLFAQALPAGSYEIALSPAIETAPFNPGEDSLLAVTPGLTGHAVVSLAGGQIIEGDRRRATGLVFPSGMLGNLGVWQTGTPFLSQLHDDLGATLDAQLNQVGDASTITGDMDSQILDTFNPALGPASQRPVGVLIIWLDPVSFSLIDPNRDRATYDLENNSYQDTISQAFVSVDRNVEVLVVPIARGVQNYRLTVNQAPAGVRGGEIYLGANLGAVTPLTTALARGPPVSSSAPSKHPRQSSSLNW